MALLIKTSEALEARATDVKLPRMTNLQLCSFMNGSIEKACRNLAPNKNDMTYVGAPVVSDNRIGIHSYNSYFQTDIPESEVCTLLSVARLTSAGTTGSNRPMIISTLENANGIGQFGVSQFLNSASTTGSAELVPTATPTLQNWSASTVITPTDWHFHYTIIGATSAKQGSKTGGTPGTDTSPVAARSVSSRNWRVGSSYSSGYAGTADVAFAAIYDAALSDAEITALYDFVKPILAARSTPIAI